MDECSHGATHADGFAQDDCEDTFDCACLLRTFDDR